MATIQRKEKWKQIFIVAIISTIITYFFTLLFEFFYFVWLISYQKNSFS